MKLWPFSKKRAPTPSKRAYAAAQVNRLTADWIAMRTSADTEIYSSLVRMRDRSRQMERDNDFIRAYLRECENNVIGLGIPFQGQVRMQRGGKLNDALNAQIEDKWTEWCKANNCHTGGRLSFFEIERLHVRSSARDGEFLVRKVRQKFGKSKVPLALEIIEADMLDETYNGVSADGNKIRMGVETDPWGRPLAYYFYHRHPGDTTLPNGNIAEKNRRRRIPADEIIHNFMTERAGQTRGVPWVVSSLMRLRQVQGYEEAEVIAARASAALMGFIETDQGELRGDEVVGDQRVTEFEPGVFKQLNPGEHINVPNIQRPGTTFDPFMRMMIRATAAGCGSSYQALSKDSSQSNYSSSRLDLLSERDHWRVVQQWVIANFHQPIFEEWLEMAVLAGELSLPGYDLAPEKYTGVRWLPRGWAWVDPQKEVAAYKEAVLAGFKSSADIIAQEGGDYEETYQAIYRERQLAKSLGLKFDTDVENQNTGSPPKPGNPGNTPDDTGNQ